jgi:ubiquinol-cytochrome c reductase cytochrome b subunit
MSRLILAVAVMCIVVQFATGVLLMTVYSPSTAAAWGSVWFIQTQMSAGWFIRGLHTFAAEALLASLLLYVAVEVWTFAYARRSLVQWFWVLALLTLVLGASLSGYLLPWDQDGFWGTTVRINILAKTPWFGDALRQLLVGGHELGQLTLTRFYTLHVVLIPLCVTAVAFLVLTREVRESVKQASRPSISGESKTGSRLDQRDVEQLAAAGLFFALALLVYFVCKIRGEALLGAPGDPTTADYPARPEWHTRFLFQWLKGFSGPTAEMFGAIVIPGGFAIVLLSFPWIARRFGRPVGHWIVLTVSILLVAGFAGLTFASWRDDAEPPAERIIAIQRKQPAGRSLTHGEQAVLRSFDFNRKKDRAQFMAKRALALAEKHGIPPVGPLELLRADPLTRGPELFAAHCASCHRYKGHDGLGAVPAEPAAASDLFNFASQEWIRGLLDDPMANRYFGRMENPDGEPAHTRMSRFVSEQLEFCTSEECRSELFKNFAAVAAYLEAESVEPRRFLAHESAESEADTTRDVGPSARMDPLALARRGREYFLDVCNECHSYDGERSGTFHAPDFAGYGSVAWIEAMIEDPASEFRYRSRGREPAQMPAFRDRLTADDRRLIAAWIHQSREVDLSIPATQAEHD